MDQELKLQFQKIDQRFDGLTNFLQKHMVTKEEFSELSVRVDKLEETVNKLVQVVEKLASAVNKILEEHTSMKYQLLTM